MPETLFHFKSPELLMDILETISLFSILLPSGMVFLWNRLSVGFRIIMILVLFTLIMEIINTIMFKYGINNMIMFHLFTYVEALLVFLYFIATKPTPAIRLIYTVTFLAFICFSIINSLFYSELENYNSLQRAVECIWVILLSALFYIDIFNRSQITDLSRSAHFWMTSVFLIYFAGMLFMNIIGDTYNRTDLIKYNVWAIHSVLNSILNITYTLTIWLDSRASTLER